MTIEEIIRNWSKAQDAGCILPCPRCGKIAMNEHIELNALSRKADIYICDECGQWESVEDTIDTPYEKSLEEWFIATDVYKITPYRTRNGYKSYKICAGIDVNITAQDIDDIMGDALDYITYWCRKAEVAEGAYYGEYASDQISRGGTLILYDRESDDKWTLTLEKFLFGFKAAIEDGYADDWFEDGKIEWSYLDGPAVDVIVQLALFGEVVYG